MTANIEPIADKITWSAKAAAMHAFESVQHDTPFLALWLDADGVVRWSKSNLTFPQQSELNAVLQAMTTKWAIDGLLS
jgi:hypothetical protein